MSSTNSTNTGRGTQTTWSQRAAMIEWLQNRNNFNLVSGKATSTMSSVVAGVSTKKTDGYKDLADFVNTRCATTWTEKTGKSRYEATVKKYRDTVRDSGKTGFGLTDDHHAKGIHTVEELLEHMSPSFGQLDALFGGRQNVRPGWMS